MATSGFESNEYDDGVIIATDIGSLLFKITQLGEKSDKARLASNAAIKLQNT